MFSGIVRFLAIGCVGHELYWNCSLRCVLLSGHTHFECGCGPLPVCQASKYIIPSGWCAARSRALSESATLYPYTYCWCYYRPLFKYNLQHNTLFPSDINLKWLRLVLVWASPVSNFLVFPLRYSAYSHCMLWRFSNPYISR
jgi:hypothetical protein